MRFWKKESVAYPDRDLERKYSSMSMLLMNLEKKLAAAEAENEIFSEIINGDQREEVEKLQQDAQDSNPLAHQRPKTVAAPPPRPSAALPDSKTVRHTTPVPLAAEEVGHGHAHALNFQKPPVSFTSSPTSRLNPHASPNRPTSTPTPPTPSTVKLNPSNSKPLPARPISPWPVSSEPPPTIPIIQEPTQGQF